jgi:hypothetical protein
MKIFRLQGFERLGKNDEAPAFVPQSRDYGAAGEGMTKAK